MVKRQWVFGPHSGGVKIPEAVRRRTTERIKKYAAKRYAGKYTRLDIRFRGALCYVDAYVEPEEPSRQLLKITGETRQQFLDRVRAVPVHLFRLRHFTENEWSVAFFTYINERYTPCIYDSGRWVGTPEEAFGQLAVYLR